MDGMSPLTDRASIEAAARDLGIIRGDPAYPFVQLMLERHDQHAVEHREHEARLTQLLAQAEKLASGQITRSAAADLPRAIDRLVLHRASWWLCIAAAVWAASLAGAWYAGDLMRRRETIQVAADLSALVTASDAPYWLHLIELNGRNGAVRHCENSVRGPGGESCDFRFWNSPPSAP